MDNLAFVRVATEIRLLAATDISMDGRGPGRDVHPSVLIQEDPHFLSLDIPCLLVFNLGLRSGTKTVGQNSEIYISSRPSSALPAAG